MSNPNDLPAIDAVANRRWLTGAVMSWSGVAMIIAGAACFFYLGIKLIRDGLRLPPFFAVNSGIKSDDPALAVRMVDYYLTLYAPLAFLTLVAIVALIAGIVLLRSARFATRQVIPSADKEILYAALRADLPGAIDNYIRLSSLSGITGKFTQLGFTGLPLATLAITLIFALLSLVADTADLSKSLFDLSKLTLGAFLGSYVQRQRDDQRFGGARAPGRGATTGRHGA